MKITSELIKRIFLDIFSSSQIIFIYFIILHTIYYFNIYTFYLYLSIFLKTYLLSLIKTYTIKMNVGKRPSGAFNCNMFSCGGKSITGGMPSGHMTLLFMFFTLFYINFQKLDLLNNIFIKGAIFIIILTAIGRYFSKYHTLLQIFMGSLLGIILGLFLYLIESIIGNYSETFNKNKELFYRRIYYQEEKI